MKHKKPQDRCKECGFRNRGTEHEDGLHHRTKVRPKPWLWSKDSK